MVTKRFLTALIALMFVSVPALAQDNSVYFGLRGGLGFGTTPASDSASEDLKEWGKDYKWKSGGGSFDIAPFVGIQLADAFALQTELLFTSYGYGGYKYTGSDNEYEKNGDYYTLSKKAMVIPVLAKVTLFERKLSIFAGPHFSVNYGAGKTTTKEKGNKTSKNASDEDMKYYKDNTKDPLMGLTVGADYGFAAGPGRLFFDARYLTDFGKTKFKYSNDEWKTDKNSIRRAKLAFSVGYEFGASRR
ncbi:MAG: PorT family protein [Acidobacteriota bacterium]|jgi:hypothetical protein|nr:PorT family protein [Acidobacteriota bacterium]